MEILKTLNSYTTELNDGNVFVSAAFMYPFGMGFASLNDPRRLHAAGVKALRCGERRLTSYPSQHLELDYLRALHVAVRTGDFHRFSNTEDNLVIFGVILSVPLYKWLKNSSPGTPLKNIIQFLRGLAAESSLDKLGIMEGQLEPSVAEAVLNGLQKTEKRSSVKLLTDSELNHFKLPFEIVYLREDDWKSIVENGKKDSMCRAESRTDVWAAWLACYNNAHPDYLATDPVPTDED